MATEIRVPTLGESVTEATIGTWFKKVGDAIATDEPVVELETDKVTIEVPAPTSGTLAEIELASRSSIDHAAARADRLVDRILHVGLTLIGALIAGWFIMRLILAYVTRNVRRTA